MIQERTKEKSRRSKRRGGKEWNGETHTIKMWEGRKGRYQRRKVVSNGGGGNGETERT